QSSSVVQDPTAKQVEVRPPVGLALEHLESVRHVSPSSFVVAIRDRTMSHACHISCPACALSKHAPLARQGTLGREDAGAALCRRSRLAWVHTRFPSTDPCTES